MGNYYSIFNAYRRGRLDLTKCLSHSLQYPNKSGLLVQSNCKAGQNTCVDAPFRLAVEVE